MSANAEASVIGALLLDPQALYRIDDPLRAADFQQPANRKAYATICRMLKAGEPVDFVTLSESGGGDLSYLGALAKDTPGSHNISSYAAIVKAAARRSRLELSLKNGLTQLQDGEPVEDIRQAVMTAIEGDTQPAGRSFADVVTDALTGAAQAGQLRQSGAVIGVSTGLPILNHLTGGFHGPKLIVLGGRPGTFKTAYALQVASRAAANGQPVGFVSLEMGAEELATRAVANALLLNGADLSHGEADALKAAQAASWDWPLHIEDKLYRWPDIAARIIGWKHRHDIALAVIDYLQIIQLPGKGSRFEKLGEVSREAKLLAKRLGIPILLLAQISREVEKEKRRPVLSDIRECGNVEQDADMVLFTHRHQPKDKPEQYELILAKQRNGPARKIIRLKIDGASYLIGEVWNQSI